MTSTPVSSEVNNLLFSMSSPKATKGMDENTFSDVFKQQTGSATEGKTPKKPEQTTVKKTEEIVSETKETKPKEAPKDAEETQDVKPSQEENLEDSRIPSEAEELAMELLAQLSQMLGISQEETAAMLLDADITPMDLLSQEGLTEALLQGSGETEPLALLTNETLYQDLQQLQSTLESGLEEIASAMDVDVETLQTLLQEAKTMKPQVQMPENLKPETMNQEVEMPITRENQERNVSSRENMQMESETGLLEGDQVMLQRSLQEGADRQGQNLMNQSDQQAIAYQTVANQQAQVAVENTFSMDTYFSPDTQMIMDQIVEQMKLNVGDGLTQLEMQLHPESLGTLQVQIASKDGAITAHFTAQNEAVKQALETQMVQLKESFQEQGVKVEAVEVTVESHAFERNLEQGREGSQDNNPEKKSNNKVRRLNLNELQESDELLLGDLNQEQRLSAELMMQNGGTVDYTA